MLKYLPPDSIDEHFRFIRGRWVLPESELARIYALATERLLKQLQPYQPLPGEFCFYFESHELMTLGIRPRRSGSPPLAFTEHGVLAAAWILGCPLAIARSVPLVRAFVQLRETGMVHEGRGAV